MMAGAGTFTLRLGPSTPDGVDYEGTLEVAERTVPVRARIALPGGAVTIDTAGEAPPEWLVEAVRATLRAAYRSSRAGVRWPRRISRFREAKGDGDAERRGS